MDRESPGCFECVPADQSTDLILRRTRSVGSVASVTHSAETKRSTLPNGAMMNPSRKLILVLVALAGCGEDKSGSGGGGTPSPCDRYLACLQAVVQEASVPGYDQAVLDTAKSAYEKGGACDESSDARNACNSACQLALDPLAEGFPGISACKPKDPSRPEDAGAKDAPTPVIDGECQQYLSCLATVSPASYAAALTLYGASAACWDTPTQAKTCNDICSVEFEKIKGQCGYCPSGSGLTDCGAEGHLSCVDLKTDENNCGQCGRQCAQEFPTDWSAQPGGTGRCALNGKCTGVIVQNNAQSCSAVCGYRGAACSDEGGFPCGPVSGTPMPGYGECGACGGIIGTLQCGPCATVFPQFTERYFCAK